MIICRLVKRSTAAPGTQQWGIAQGMGASEVHSTGTRQRDWVGLHARVLLSRQKSCAKNRPLARSESSPAIVSDEGFEQCRSEDSLHAGLTSHAAFSPI